MLALTSPTRRLLALVLAALVAALGVTACGAGSTGVSTSTLTGTPTSTSTSTPTGPGASAEPGAVPTPSDAASLAPADPVSTLRTMLVAALPAEGVDTLRLIDSGGPFPYSKDGVTFSNRERLLPEHPSGWYQEYTVITPGSTDRGARRIVGGRSGERYYTDDHYASFREVLSGVPS